MNVHLRVKNILICKFVILVYQLCVVIFLLQHEAVNHLMCVRQEDLNMVAETVVNSPRLPKSKDKLFELL
jgi:hypothetical protein